jgi:holo-[acyl-carrier protein] synthase
MIIGIGTDIVDISRMQKILERQGDKFVSRILSKAEQKLLRGQFTPASIAKRFAAKEAVAKSLGTGIGYGVSFQDITISNDSKGAPLVNLSGGAAKVLHKKSGTDVLLSLSDERDYAIAYAVLISQRLM